MTDLAEPTGTDAPGSSPWSVPVNLSPSRVESFLSCPLSFRFSSIEKLPERPTLAATRGSLVHRALELLFTRPPEERTAAALDASVDDAIAEYRVLDDFTGLQLDADATARFDTDCRRLAANYLEMEDPTTVRDIGLELRLEAPVGDLVLRGIIDRLELDDAGDLVVTDYKTGRAPSPNWERKSLSGLNFYAFLCESLFDRRPAAIRLMYLSSKETITATPTEQSTRFLTTRTAAVWKAVATACERDDFRPRRGRLCDYCSFQRWCPEFGGDPSLAAVEAPLAVAVVARRCVSTDAPPGRQRFGPAIERFDTAADRWLERRRGDPVLDRVMVLATDLGEFSAIWHLSSAVRGLIRRRPDQIVGLAVGIGLESLIVNQGLKRLFRRPRPTTGGDQRFDIRAPMTSSFPSGHASAAGFAATTLIGWDGPRTAPLWALMAGTVAASRPYVRIHHASDVVAGVGVGITMGLIARRIFRAAGLG